MYPTTTVNPATQPAIYVLPSLLLLREEAAKARRKVVLTNGCFDLLHRGHVEYLQHSAALGDLLFVAINSDDSVRELKGPTRPLNSEQDRAYVVASLACVTAVFIFKGPRLAEEIKQLRPDIYTKAGDYTIQTLETSEREALLAARVNIQFLPFITGHSTTNTLTKLGLT